MKYTAVIEIEVGEECVRSKGEVDHDKPVTAADSEQYVRTELGWASDSFDGYEIKELKPC